MDIFLLIIGVLILLLIYYDFFHTTLSGLGFGFMSGKLNKFLGKLVMRNRDTFIFKYSGFIHLLSTALFWLSILVLGAFLIYASSPNMVVNSHSHIPATLLERIYFTGFVVSTLGVGDFVPGNDLSRILTTFLSFSGFILLTTALTYLISVVQTVLQKRQLALYISTLGNDIDELYQTVTPTEGINLLTENASSLREMVIKNSSNQIFFPIAQYFVTAEKEAALELQLTRLYEVLNVLSFHYSAGSGDLLKVKAILAAITSYLKLGIHDEESSEFKEEVLKDKREYWTQHGINFRPNKAADTSMDAALKKSGWTWKDVYTFQESNASSFKE